jgi:hypothetical protein
MVGAAPRGGSIFEDIPCRTVWTKVLPETGVYAQEEHLDGWFNITAEGDNAYVFPGSGSLKWGKEFEGIFIPQNKTITRRLDNIDLGYYSAVGVVRLEKIEFVKED